MKPKGRGSAKNIFNMCDNTSCDSVNIDNQLAIIDKCSRLYFICKRCEDKNGDNSTLTPTSPTADLEKFFTTKLQRIGERIDETITKKLADNYKKY